MKKKLNIILILLLLFFTLIISAQVNTDLRPQVKSPEVNKFEQYMNMPVNLVSGTPQVSIPIYTLEYGGMTLPISLEYDASGVKVESIASSVGQNWSLNVGGVVSRIVKGAPDEGNPYNWTAQSLIDINGFYRDYGLTYLESKLNSYTNQSYSPTNFDNRAIEFGRWVADLSHGVRDSQPDLFYFNTPQGGSKFVFNDQRQVVYLENTDFVIKENFVPNDFKSWDVTSPSGIKYKFGIDNPTGYEGRGNVAETSQTFYQDWITNGGGVGGIQNQYIVNSWFLTEMTNFQTNQKITLNYVDNQYTQKVNASQSQFTGSYWPVYSNGVQIGCTGGVACNSTDEGAYNSIAKQYTQYLSTNNVMSKLISSIIAGDTQINFIYSTRDDLEPLNVLDPSSYPKKLDEIQILYKQNCIKKFTFNITTTTSLASTNSFNADPDLYCRKRLFLNGITESSCTLPATIKPYSFIYNQTPLPHRVSYAQDNWGYYNGKLSNPIIYPSFKFFGNTDGFADRSVDFNSAKAGSLEKIIYPTKGTVEFNFEPHQATTPTDYLYNKTPDLILLTGQPESQNGANGGSEFKSIPFIFSGNSTQLLSLTSTLMFPNPIHSLGSYCSNPSTGIAAEIMDNSITPPLRVALNNYGTNGTVTSFYDSSSFVNGRTYILNLYGDLCNHNMTQIGIHNTTPVYDVGGLRIQKITHKDADGSILKVNNYTYLEPNVIENPKKNYKINYNSIDEMNSFFLKKTNGIPFLSAGNIAYIQKYMSDEAYSNPALTSTVGSFRFISSGHDPLQINFMGPNISYGTVIETDGNGSTTHVFNRYKNYFELNGFSNPTVFPSPPLFQSILAGDKSGVFVKDNNNIGVKSNYYEYNYSTVNTNVNAIVNLKTGNWNCDSHEKGYSYYGQIKTLKTETETTTLGGVPVTTQIDYQYNGVNHFMPTQTTTTNSKGDVLTTKTAYPEDTAVASEPFMPDLKTQNRKIPIKTETFNGTTKLSEQHTQFANDATTGNLVLPKNEYAAKFPNSNPNITIPPLGQLEKKVTYDLYDTNGTLLQYTPDSGVPVSIIWGYNRTQPIAKIENATYASIPAATITNLQSLSDLDIDSASEANLAVALNALRTSLPSAFVTTYTYNPLIGVTSITDPKGLPTYYEYDSFNRLKFIKDRDLNVLQRNCYNYKGQTIDCSQIGQTVPTAPIGLTLSSATTNSLNFSWTAVTGATGYKIYKNGVYVSSTTVPSGSLSGLASSTVYGVQVLAYNGTGDGALSSSVAMTTSAASMGFYKTSGTYPTTTASTLNGTILNTLTTPIYIYLVVQSQSTPSGSGSGSVSINGTTISASGTFTNYGQNFVSTNSIYNGVLGSAITVSGNYYGTAGSQMILAYSLSPGGALFYWSSSN